MRNTTVVILALAVALLTVLSFREAASVRQARIALATAVAERDALRDRLNRSEQEQQSLTAENASLRTAANAVAARPAPAGDAQFKPFTRAVPRGRMPGPMEAFDSPEMRPLMAIEQKGRLDGRYAALFKALRLPPDKLDAFKQLLVDKQSAAMDVLAAAHRQELLNPGSGADIGALVKKEQEGVDAAIQDLLGPTAFEEYQDYERTRAQRGVVDQLSSRLSYTDNPLSARQAEALVDLLAAERSTRPEATGQPAGAAGMQVAFAAGAGDTVVSLGPMGPGDAAAISDASLAAAQTVLSDAQLAALRELQAEQQARRQAGELLRRTLPIPGPGAEAGTTATATLVGPPAAEGVPAQRP